MPTANHTVDDVEYTVKCMKELKAKFDQGGYNNHALLK